MLWRLAASFSRVSLEVFHLSHVICVRWAETCQEKCARYTWLLLSTYLTFSRFLFFSLPPPFCFPLLNRIFVSLYIYLSTKHCVPICLSTYPSDFLGLPIWFPRCLSLYTVPVLCESQDAYNFLLTATAPLPPGLPRRGCRCISRRPTWRAGEGWEVEVGDPCGPWTTGCLFLVIP